MGKRNRCDRFEKMGEDDDGEIMGRFIGLEIRGGKEWMEKRSRYHSPIHLFSVGIRNGVSLKFIPKNCTPFTFPGLFTYKKFKLCTILHRKTQLTDNVHGPRPDQVRLVPHEYDGLVVGRVGPPEVLQRLLRLAEGVGRDHGEDQDQGVGGVGGEGVLGLLKKTRKGYFH